MPVGPGHDAVSLEAVASVWAAWEHTAGPFGKLELWVVDDHEGELGRSAARNRGLAATNTDWVFLVDADDLLDVGAFDLPSLDADAYWGSVYTDRCGHVSRQAAGTWEAILAHPTQAGTLSMGCFVRGDIARRTMFLEHVDAGEDFEWFLAVIAQGPFVKLKRPLVIVRQSVPGAVGPRGRRDLSVTQTVKPLQMWWKARGRVPATYAERQAAFKASPSGS